MKKAVDKRGKVQYNNKAVENSNPHNGVWRSLVSRLVRDQEASGSNPDTPTKTGKFLLKLAGFYFCVLAFVFSGKFPEKSACFFAAVVA